MVVAANPTADIRAKFALDSIGEASKLGSSAATLSVARMRTYAYG